MMVIAQKGVIAAIGAVIGGLIVWYQLQKEKDFERPIPMNSSVRSVSSEITENDVTESMNCPISGQIMKNPVVAKCGHSFEKAEIEKWI